MVEAAAGALLTCTDEATQQFVQFLNSQKMIDGKEFILQVLDSTHLFVDAKKVPKILEEIDKFSDSNAYSAANTEDEPKKTGASSSGAGWKRKQTKR